MRSHRNPNAPGGRSNVQELAESFLAECERIATLPRLSTTQAVGEAAAAYIRQQPAKAVAAHGAPADSGVYSMRGGNTDVIATRTAAPRRIELRAEPRKVVLDERALDLHRAGKVRR